MGLSFLLNPTSSFFFFFPSVSSLHLYLRHHGGVFRCSLSSIFFIFIFYISLLSLCLRCHPYTLLVYSITNGLSSILYTLNTHKGTVVASLVQVCLVISFFFFFFSSHCFLRNVYTICGCGCVTYFFDFFRKCVCLFGVPLCFRVFYGVDRME